jgi:hypothetical protein
MKIWIQQTRKQWKRDTELVAHKNSGIKISLGKSRYGEGKRRTRRSVSWVLFYLGCAVPDLDPRQDAGIGGGMLLLGREQGRGSSGLLLEERPFPHQPHHHPLHLSDGLGVGWIASDEEEQRAVVYL